MCKLTEEFEECYNQAIEENGEDFDRAVELMLERHPEMDESELMMRLIEEETDEEEYSMHNSAR